MPFRQTPKIICEMPRMTDLMKRAEVGERYEENSQIGRYSKSRQEGEKENNESETVNQMHVNEHFHLHRIEE